MPTGRAIGQAILDDDADGDGHDTAGVVAGGHGQVEHVGVEVVVATRTAVLRVGDMQVTWPAGGGIAQIVQGSMSGSQTIGAAPALGADSAWEVAGSLDDPGFGKVFDASDSLGGVCNINSRSGHGILRD